MEFCPFCTKARDLLQDNNLPNKIINFEDDQKNILADIKEAYGWETIPLVLKRTEEGTILIGGYSDLAKSLENAG